VVDLPKPPLSRQAWFGVLAVAVVLAVAAAVVAAQLRQPSGGPRGAAAGAPPTTGGDWTQSTPPPDKGSSTAPTGVLWAASGSDTETGRLFSAPSAWRIVWQFDCRSFAKYGGGNFKLSGDGDFARVSVQEFAVKQGGTKRVSGGGRGRLIVESVCDHWSVRAVAP
jgi:hypothetical protein